MHVWVIEMKSRNRGKWEPCADAKLTRKDAEREAEYYWGHNNPDHDFRVKKYVPSTDQRGR